MEMEKFRAWLKRSAGLGDRSAKDVVSRLRRVATLVNIDSGLATDDLLHKLGKNPQFKELKLTVRSQLRRAVKLYREFGGDHE